MLNPTAPVADVHKKVTEKAAAKRDSLAERFPLSFALLGSFGLVCTFYGFEKLIDKFPVFTDQPWILLITGISTLVMTGLALRKL